MQGGTIISRIYLLISLVRGGKINNKGGTPLTFNKGIPLFLFDHKLGSAIFIGMLVN